MDYVWFAFYHKYGLSRTIYYRKEKLERFVEENKFPIIVPVSAVRDEGTSYHYLEPSREIECHKETVKNVVSYLKEMGVSFRTGKTWTSHAIYRETPDMIERRRNEGCITVEMEAAAFFAVSHYYHIPLAQLLYAGDDVSGEEWDSLNWNTQKNIRYELLRIAIEVVKKL